MSARALDFGFFLAARRSRLRCLLYASSVLSPSPLTVVASKVSPQSLSLAFLSLLTALASSAALPGGHLDAGQPCSAPCHHQCSPPHILQGVCGGRSHLMRFPLLSSKSFTPFTCWKVGCFFLK